MSSYDFLESETWTGESASALKSARRARGLTQEQMGQATGIGRARYSFIEYPPKPRSPSPDEREAIRRALEDEPAAHARRGARGNIKPSPAPAQRQRHDLIPSTIIDGNRTLYGRGQVLPTQSKRATFDAMIKTVPYVDALQNPIEVLEKIFRSSGMSLIQAAFRYSFFLDPEKVRAVPVKYPEFARYSRKYYPGKQKGDDADWNGRRIELDDNRNAQKAWAWYSGRRIERGSGYGVRHIWGNPWNPDAFTAGWNLCYMPFWVGMLTEDQHPHPGLQRAIQQASYDLYFRRNPVCSPPDFVKDPGVDLKKILGEQPVLIL